MKSSTLKSPIAQVLLLTTLLVGLLAPLASASTCGETCNYTWPDSQACQTNPDYAVRTHSIAGQGLLELRYDSGCRTIWGRMPSNLNSTNFYAWRWGSCSLVDTEAYSIMLGGDKKWTRQLNDAGCLGYTYVLSNGSPYSTSPGY